MPPPGHEPETPWSVVLGDYHCAIPPHDDDDDDNDDYFDDDKYITGLTKP